MEPITEAQFKEAEIVGQSAISDFWDGLVEGYKQRVVGIDTCLVSKELESLMLSIGKAISVDVLQQHVQRDIL